MNPCFLANPSKRLSSFQATKFASAGLVGALDYLAIIGREQASLYTHAFRDAKGETQYHARQRDLKIAMQAIMDYERAL